MKIIVDTGQDIVDANDGVTSLREAIALAEATAGADEIVFAESLLGQNGTLRINIDTDPRSPSLIGSTRTDFTGYAVNSGDGLTINGDIDGDGVADVELNGGFITNDDRYFITPHFQIGAEGDLRLEALNLIGGGMVFFTDAADGGAPTGSNKSPAGADGQDAFGSILNEGALALDRVRIDGTTAIAQNGGDGGAGAAGENNKPFAISGRDGDYLVAATGGGDGLDGNNGFRGGSGGDGGDAAGAILNRGELTLINSAFGANFTAEAGDGGDGGDGGRGGDGRNGGTGGDGYTHVPSFSEPLPYGTTAKDGGDGGDAGIPGAGGVGGDGGAAALAILNDGGTVTHQTALALDEFDGAAVAGDAGAGGTPGDRGTAGSGGLGGQKTFGGRADRGSDGVALPGSPFIVDGSAGSAADFSAGAAPGQAADAIVFVRTDQTEVMEGEDLIFQIGRSFSNVSYSIIVSYEVILDGAGLSAGDFADGVALSGQVVLDPNAGGAVLRLSTVIDGVLEQPELAALTITGVQANFGPGSQAISEGTAGVRIVSDRDADLALDNDFAAMAGGDTLEGLGGDDTLRGSAAGDLLLGGADDDSVTGAGGLDTIEGGDGDDFLDGGTEGDEITGGRGGDSLFGGAGDDTLVDREAQEEAVEGGPSGDDLYDGGAGADRLIYNAARSAFAITRVGDDLVVTGAGGADTVRASVETIVFGGGGPGAEAVSVAALLDALAPEDTSGGGGSGGEETSQPNAATSGADRLFGTAGADRMSGLGGDDLMAGGGGADEMRGDAGNDTLQGGGGADKLFGGAGRDKAVGGAGGDIARGGAGADTVAGGKGNDRLFGDDGGDRLIGGQGRDTMKGGAGADRLFGGGDADRLIGQNGDDVMNCGGGADRLFGGGGDDRGIGGAGRDLLIGGAGDDTLSGGGGADTLKGGGGADRLTGGRGGDDLYGGAGRDVFVFARGDGRDTIHDFRQGQDRIKVGAGANDFGDLDIRQAGDDVAIRFANVTIIVEDENAGAFAASDFIF